MRNINISCFKKEKESKQFCKIRSSNDPEPNIHFIKEILFNI